MRCRRGFCRRTGLSKNNCLARCDGAFFHFLCRNFVNSCCKGCERAERKNTLDQNTAKREEFNASIQEFEVTIESTPKGTRLRNASDKVRTPRCVQVSEVRSKTSTMHLGILVVRYRGEGRGLALEGGAREDAQARVSWHFASRQAWQADGDDELTWIRPSSSKRLRLRTATVLFDKCNEEKHFPMVQII